MTALARKLGLSQATGLSISIIAPTAAMALNVRLSEQLGKKHFSIDITLIEAPTPRESAKSREGGGEPRRPERDPEGDVYGKNGERMPYYPRPWSRWLEKVVGSGFSLNGERLWLPELRS